MEPNVNETGKGRIRVLSVSTIGFTLMFAVWLMFGVLGIPIRQEFGLSDIELSWLSAVAVLNGAIWRLFAGIMTDRYGGRIVSIIMFFVSAIPAYLVSRAGSYEELLLYAFLVGFTGNYFSVGIAWNSAWFGKERQGLALGIFGAGNVGASVTKFIGPAIIAAIPVAGYFGGLIPGGWRFVPFLYAVLLVTMGIATWLIVPKEDKIPGNSRRFAEMIRPVKGNLSQEIRAWRFSLYYVVMFGAYVALSSWLPKYYVDVFGLPLYEAALLTALFIFPASLLRPVGGWLSDRFGARRVMYWSFAIILVSSGILMSFSAISVWFFTLFVFSIGIGMGFGKAAVYKHIPVYFPQDVGAVGGLVGLLGALGGFSLPPIFAYLGTWSGLPQTTWMVLFVLTFISFAWMHMVVRSMKGKEVSRLRSSH